MGRPTFPGAAPPTMLTFWYLEIARVPSDQIATDLSKLYCGIARACRLVFAALLGATSSCTYGPG